MGGTWCYIHEGKGRHTPTHPGLLGMAHRKWNLVIITYSYTDIRALDSIPTPNPTPSPTRTPIATPHISPSQVSRTDGMND